MSNLFSALLNLLEILRVLQFSRWFAVITGSLCSKKNLFRSYLNLERSSAPLDNISSGRVSSKRPLFLFSETFLFCKDNYMNDATCISLPCAWPDPLTPLLTSPKTTRRGDCQGFKQSQLRSSVCLA